MLGIVFIAGTVEAARVLLEFFVGMIITHCDQRSKGKAMVWLGTLEFRVRDEAGLSLGHSCGEA